MFIQGEIRNERYTDRDDVASALFSKVVIAMPGHELKSLDRPEQNPAAEGLIPPCPTRSAGWGFSD